MKIISHRGNVRGPIPEKENRPSYIDCALGNGYDVEIHLDINTDPMEGSSCVAQQAAGYVLGVTGLEPKLKPEGFAASHGADGIAHGRDQIRVNTHV